MPSVDVESLEASPSDQEMARLAGRLDSLGRAAGLDAVGVAAADPFLAARQTLEQRKAAGLHGGMDFTYRNPARSTDPGLALPGARSLVVGARSYRRREPAPAQAPARAPAGGQVARYSWIDHYRPLRRALAEMAALLAGEGWAARVLVDDNSLVDREAAYRAGIGWYGKNANLLLPGRGSWFVLGSVVTDAPLPPADGPAPDGCGACSRCLPACPTGALVGPGILDARRCLAWLLESPGTFPRRHRVALGGRVYGCDDCQEVCPPNHLEIRRRPPPAAEPGSEAVVDLLDMLEEPDDRVLLARFARWYVPRRQARYLRRNALVALGNVADGADARVGRALVAALAAGEAVVRAHAVWAAGRLGRADLVEGMADGETDPDVLAELAELPGPR